MISKSTILNEQNMWLFIQLSLCYNGDWKESIRNQNMSFARLKFAEWRSALNENVSLNWGSVSRRMRVKQELYLEFIINMDYMK